MEDRKTLKQKQAEERQAVYSALSSKERLAKLDAVLGPGQGAAKERAKLAALLEKEKKS
jgi:hypothetical protein